MRWIVATIILIYGIITLDYELNKWVVLGAIFYSSPLLFQSLPIKSLQIWSLWGGIFLILQSLISPLLIDRNLVFLQPNLHEIVNVKDGLPGIEGKQVITTDARGFRTTKSIDYDSQDSFRIFTVGGSTTEEILLDDRHTWSNLLIQPLEEAGIKNVEVINTGVSGLRAKNHVSTLRYIASMHPDLVIFLTGINDWNWHIRNSLSGDDFVEDTSISVRQYFSLKHSLIGNAFRALFAAIQKTGSGANKPIERSEFGEYYSKQRDSLSRDITKQFLPNAVHAQFEENIEKISELCKAIEIKCMFLSQPNGYQEMASEEFKKGFWMTPPNEPYALDFRSMKHIAKLYNNYIKQFSQNNNHLFCDTANQMEPSFNSFYDDCHFNTIGAQKMSNLVSNCLKRNLTEMQN